MREHYRSAEAFSRDAFVSNYCPLLFLDLAGRNVTPDKIYGEDRERLYSACDRFLDIVIETLRPEWLVGVGAFAARRARAVVSGGSGATGLTLPGRGVRVTSVLHPSPASPRANRDWATQVEKSLLAQRVW
jgi:single-strand selective monofunctional uracil DNA glycosylase